MNELFSKSLNDAVTKTADEIADLSTAYIDKSLEAHTQSIDAIINKYESAFIALATHVDDNTGKLSKYGEMLQSRLNKSIKAYNSSIKGLIALNSKEKKFFFLGILGGIATPTILLLRMLADALIGIFG